MVVKKPIEIKESNEIPIPQQSICGPIGIIIQWLDFLITTAMMEMATLI
jgi:hypothetical protein